MTMIVLVVDIPSCYRFLLFGKWSVMMRGIMQSDLSYATFNIGDKAINIDREPRATYVFEDSVDKDATCFLDTEVNAFRAELVIQENEKPPLLIV